MHPAICIQNGVIAYSFIKLKKKTALTALFDLISRQLNKIYTPTREQVTVEMRVSDIIDVTYSEACETMLLTGRFIVTYANEDGTSYTKAYNDRAYCFEVNAQFNDVDKFINAIKPNTKHKIEQAPIPISL